MTRIARAILVKIPVEMCQFTGIPMTRFKVAFTLQNFCQCAFKMIEKEKKKPQWKIYNNWAYSRSIKGPLKPPADITQLWCWGASAGASIAPCFYDAERVVSPRQFDLISFPAWEWSLFFNTSLAEGNMYICICVYIYIYIYI